MEVLMVAAYGEGGQLDHLNRQVKSWKNGALSGSNLAIEPPLESVSTKQHGKTPLPNRSCPTLGKQLGK